MDNSHHAAGECRFCRAPLTQVFADLGMSPVSNAFRRPEQRAEMEPFYPLRAYVCNSCWLVQLDDFQSPEAHFHGDYAYFSSYSTSWLKHAEAYAAMMTERFGYDSNSLVVEVASNDGYLLQYFKQRGIRILGVEPSANVAEVAERERGVPSRVCFFGKQTATQLHEEGYQADLMLGNNVLAHVPDINDFVSGFPIMLKPHGVLTFEFPHLANLIEQNQFDTIYHEHYSYLSLLTVEKILAAHGMVVFDVEELMTHGGSLRVFAQHRAALATRPEGERVQRVRDRELGLGLNNRAVYDGFAERVRRTKRDLLRFLNDAKDAGKSIVGYGAPAKGNTLLNFCGVGNDFIDYTVDRSPHKQGQYLPGTGIPIYEPERIFETKPDYVLILPWNLRNEIVEQMSEIRSWGGQFVTPIPKVQVLA